MKIKLNPEFGVELVLGVPFAYALHLDGELETVITSRGMKPFYFFCDDVREEFTTRTVDNFAAGVYCFPNNWIHHNAFALTGKDYQELSLVDQSNVNGVLDYTKWKCPNYKNQYKSEYPSPRTVVITNKYNIEHGEVPRGYFDIPCLVNMFEMLINRDFRIIYKRATNKNPEFAYDENELATISSGNYDNITGRVSWRSDVITDFDLVDDYKFKGVTNMEYEIGLLMKANPSMTYNEAQLRIMADSDHFISVCGGNAILSALFGGKVIIYVHKGKELRQNYFGPNSYFRALSGATILPVLDPVANKPENDYSGIYEAIRDHFFEQSV